MVASKGWKAKLIVALLSLTTLGAADRPPAREVSTTVVEVTATTTITQTATNSADAQGACDNFYGACVVYIGYGSPSYTTTFYNYAPSTTITSTISTTSPTPTPTTTVVTSFSTHTVVVQTTTVNNAGECSNYNGACVVYETGGSGAVATTVYAGSDSGRHSGNPGGFIGLTPTGNGDGAIGAGASLDTRWSAFWAQLVVVLGCAMVFP